MGNGSAISEDQHITGMIHRRFCETVTARLDEARRVGRRHGLLPLLGTASLELLRPTTETRAGRIAVCELAPFDATEVADTGLDR